MFLSAVIAICIALWGILSNETFGSAADKLMTALKANFSWLYLGAMFLFVLFPLAVALSKWGRIRIGADDEKPEYSTLSWFAMLFGSGMEMIQTISIVIAFSYLFMLLFICISLVLALGKDENNTTLQDKTIKT